MRLRYDRDRPAAYPNGRTLTGDHIGPHTDLGPTSPSANRAGRSDPPILAATLPEDEAHGDIQGCQSNKVPDRNRLTAGDDDDDGRDDQHHGERSQVTSPCARSNLAS
jgi:hypothetical protein